MSCKFNDSGFCHNAAANAHDGTNQPSDGRCAKCRFYSGRTRGAGDAVHQVLKMTGIVAITDAMAPVLGDCNCPERRAALNAMLPFSDDKREV